MKWEESKQKRQLIGRKSTALAASTPAGALHLDPATLVHPRDGIDIAEGPDDVEIESDCSGTSPPYGYSSAATKPSGMACTGPRSEYISASRR
jgi:hypothetical protein